MQHTKCCTSKVIYRVRSVAWVEGQKQVNNEAQGSLSKPRSSFRLSRKDVITPNAIAAATTQMRTPPMPPPPLLPYPAPYPKTGRKELKLTEGPVRCRVLLCILEPALQKRTKKLISSWQYAALSHRAGKLAIWTGQSPGLRNAVEQQDIPQRRASPATKTGGAAETRPSKASGARCATSKASGARCAKAASPHAPSASGSQGWSCRYASL